MHDAVVVGAGPAGCAMASTLLQAGLDVAVVDRGSDRHAVRLGESAPPGTEQTVASIFGARAFEREHHRPAYGNRAAWGSSELHDVDFMLNPFGRGWHLDRAAFDARLLEVVRQQGARVCGAADVDRARFVCDATGRAAAVARRLGARIVTGDRLVALVGLFGHSTERDRNSTTTVEAVEDGWWYTTPIPGQRRVVAFLTDADLLGRHASRSAPAFDAEVASTQHISGAISEHGYELAGAPRLVAARTAWLDEPAGPRWVAAGDAAAAFDPLSSQGILSALIMGREAGLALVDGTPDRYRDQHRQLVGQYLAERAAVYAMERRWPEAPFWSRRRPVAA